MTNEPAAIRSSFDITDSSFLRHWWGIGGAFVIALGGHMSQTTLDFPVWADSEAPPSYPALTTDTTVDVCVIGGGIAGLSVAYHAAREGKSVVVLDAGRIAG